MSIPGSERDEEGNVNTKSEAKRKYFWCHDFACHYMPFLAVQCRELFEDIANDLTRRRFWQ